MCINRFLRCTVLVAAVATSAPALADASGTMIVAGKTTSLQEAYAARQAGASPGLPARWLVVISDQRVDADWLAAVDQAKALHASLKRARAKYFEVSLRPDGQGAEVMNLVWPGLIELKGTGSLEDFRVSRYDATRIEGEYRSLPEAPAAIGPGTEYVAFRFQITLPAVAAR